MNGRYLYEAMGGIGPDLIAEGRYLSLGKTTLRKMLELAACLVLCLSFGLSAMMLLPAAGFVPALSQTAEQAVQRERALWLLPYAAAAGLALAAWSLPMMLLLQKQREKWAHVCSALCCMLSLLLQLAGMLLLIEQRDWNIIKNYVNLFLAFAASTVFLAAAFNGFVWRYLAGKWNWMWVVHGIFLLLCLLSAVQYGFLLGRHKSWVALGGLVELVAVLVTGVCYLRVLVSGKAKTALRGSTFVLWLMQLIPFVLSILIYYYFCTVYHAICFLLGMVILFHDRKKEA